MGEVSLYVPTVVCIHILVHLFQTFILKSVFFGSLCFKLDRFYSTPFSSHDFLQEVVLKPCTLINYINGLTFAQITFSSHNLSNIGTTFVVFQSQYHPQLSSLKNTCFLTQVICKLFHNARCRTKHKLEK